MRGLSRLLCAAGLLSARSLLPDASFADEAVSTKPIPQTINVQDCNGAIHSLQPQAPKSPARVFVFLTTECPVSAGYLPRLNELCTEWNDAGVPFYGIWGDATTSPQQVAELREEYKIHFPILMDRDGSLAKRFQPTHIPEAFVLDPVGTLVYRGRIDDRYLELGKTRPAATRHDLADAVAKLLAGESIANARTQPIGCLYESLPSDETGKATITYTRDVAPILFANCLVCHREGEVGPFPLETYTDAAKRAGQLARVVDRGLMPPWKPAERHGEFIGQRTLTEEQIDTIKRWAKSGRAEGDPQDLPAMPTFTAGWRLGEPDLVLEMPVDFEVPAGGGDIFQNFVIPIDIPEDKAIAAADFIPGNPRVVHHALFYLDANGAARKLDESTPEPGYATFGNPGFLPSGSAGGWSPGKTPRRLPDGVGRRLRQNSDLVLQIHYHPSGKPETDRSKVALYFVDGKADIAADIWASNHIHDIPPGESDYRLTANYTIPYDVQMLGVVPHMHRLGRTMKATALLPDGTTRSVIDIPDWDFNWQDDYRFSTPLELPAGTQLQVEASYDNSENNPSNPNSPPQRVTWGEGTSDEMLYCFFLVRPKDPDELRPLLADVLKHEIFGQMLGRSLTGKRIRLASEQLVDRP